MQNANTDSKAPASWNTNTKRNASKDETDGRALRLFKGRTKADLEIHNFYLEGLVKWRAIARPDVASSRNL